jgi:hypothetical protein
MSGGSLDYVYCKVEEAASQLSGSSNAHFRAFGKHLFKVAKALHDVEWELSGDGAKDVVGSIRAVISPSDELRSATEDAEHSLLVLQKSIEFAKSLNAEVKTTAANSASQ